MSEMSTATLAANVCPQCGAPFRCGMENGDKECWCASLPALSQLPAKTGGESAAASCFCPACLQLRLAAEAAARAA
jgi:hypothetical protein